MAGVNADPDTGLILNQLHDTGNLFKGITEIAPLPRSVFNHSGYTLRFRQCRVHGLCNQFQAIIFRDLTQMAAGMKIQAIQPQLHTAGHLICKSLQGLCTLCRIRISQIDQITVMRQNMFCGKTVRLTVGFECLDRFLRQRRTRPLTLIFRKHGKRLRPDCGGIQRGVFHSARDGNMCSDVFHKNIPFLE